MRGHESSVCSISVHASGRYAITTSSDTAQLWDLDTFQRKRKLNIRQSVGIQKVGVSVGFSHSSWSQESGGSSKESLCLQQLSFQHSTGKQSGLTVTYSCVQNTEIFLLNYYSCKMPTAISNRFKMSQCNIKTFKMFSNFAMNNFKHTAYL